MLEFGMSAEDAVNKPKFHHQWLPDILDVENDFPENVLKELAQIGYKSTKEGPSAEPRL
jgi:gamma-glutamyltranspeptidase/glutathione hydrolase